MGFIFDATLALYLPLWERDGSPFASRDGGGHLCTVSGALWRPEGRWFDGVDDQISCGNSSGLNAVGAVTIEAWVRPAVDFTTSYYQIVDKRDAATAPTLLWAGGATQRLVLYAGVACATGKTATLLAGLWYHVAGVAVDGATANKLYLNGCDDTAATATAVFATNTANLVVGRTTTGGNTFNGTIGEVRFYHRALAAPEIQHNYLATKWRYR